MRNFNRTNLVKSLIAAITLLASLGLGHFANAQGAMFTYQGRLNHGAAMAGGMYDL